MRTDAIILQNGAPRSFERSLNVRDIVRCRGCVHMGFVERLQQQQQHKKEQIDGR